MSDTPDFSSPLDGIVEAAMSARHQAWATDGRRQTKGGDIGWEWDESLYEAERRAMASALSAVRVPEMLAVIEAARPVDGYHLSIRAINAAMRKYDEA